MGGFVDLSTVASEAEEDIVFPEREFRVAVTHAQMVLGTELRSSSRAVCVLNHLVVSPAPTYALFLDH